MRVLLVEVHHAGHQVDQAPSKSLPKSSACVSGGPLGIGRSGRVGCRTSLETATIHWFGSWRSTCSGQRLLGHGTVLDLQAAPTPVVFEVVLEVVHLQR